eukprot:8418174-Pyramimonas_sp.AAC.1
MLIWGAKRRSAIGLGLQLGCYPRATITPPFHPRTAFAQRSEVLRKIPQACSRPGRTTELSIHARFILRR